MSKHGQSVTEYLVFLGIVISAAVVFMRPGGFLSERLAHVTTQQGTDSRNVACKIFNNCDGVSSPLPLPAPVPQPPPSLPPIPPAPTPSPSPSAGPTPGPSPAPDPDQCFPAFPGALNYGEIEPTLPFGWGDPRCADPTYAFYTVTNCSFHPRFSPSESISIPFTVNSTGRFTFSTGAPPSGGFDCGQKPDGTHFECGLDSTGGFQVMAYISKQPGVVDPDNPLGTGAVEGCVASAFQSTAGPSIRGFAGDGSGGGTAGPCELEVGGAYYFNVISEQGIRDTLNGNTPRHCGIVLGDPKALCQFEFSSPQSPAGMLTPQYTPQHQDQNSCNN